MEEHQVNHPSEPMEYEPSLETEPEEDEASPSQEPPAASSRPDVNPMHLAFTLAIVFLLGLAIGFIGRPAVIRDLPIEVVVTVVPNENQAVAQANTQSTTTDNSGSLPNSTHSQSGTSKNQAESIVPSGNPTPTIMDFVLADARHFQGSEEAPVVIVKFSDFN